ncbi:MAG TPA: MBL fold metallo-hydrolase [Clostridia bacterium]|nr:MBL fold metallo-hydrolase [Clostridia bacterium]
MILETVVVGDLGTNCYIVACEKTKEALIIDPGAEPDRIVRLVEKLGVKVVGILNTHGHADHIGADEALRRKLDVPLMIHREDAPLLHSPGRNLSLWGGFDLRISPAERLLEEDDEIKVGELTFKVVHTPGHTPGGICLVGHGKAFCGDTLFAGSVGRTDLPGGSWGQLIDSIKKKIMTLADETEVFPGHGPSTTVGEERSSNPFVAD